MAEQRKHRWHKVLWSAVRTTLFTAFALVSAFGILRAWTVRGTVDDRRAELVQLQNQLVEQQVRGEALESRVAAFRTRSDVRIQTIRSELGMLRDREKFYVFK
jgi:LPS O-antigen subunit length determinant protein (WzzB/FepE family)